MTDKTAKLTAKQEQALTALLSTLTVKQAAQKSGLSEATLWRMLREPVFAQAYAEARRKAMEQTLTVLQQSCAGAVGCLLSIVQDTDAPASVRVSASRSILEYSFKATEQMDMEARLQSIEEALAAPEGKAR